MNRDFSKKDMLQLIVATEFMKEDLALYLNTHPDDKEAIKKYNTYVLECKKLKETYEANCAMLSEHDSLSPYPWQWISEPWPWEYEANFKLEKEEF
ncbi:spore coat protein CotJB [Inconstantimicrobium mannanitabidum]|uniref:Spore coat protein CotJB n=1 Tax=Inconstantimicrobium mannanitabidum TaxID=1604901 RepID=A0ACB5RFZ1_9CLOT|nr:spore coat protein CotJB [Clostridium sp. TW13]GKX68008.1 spore coat protein CotJB [Clostridium sp. TW13]